MKLSRYKILGLFFLLFIQAFNLWAQETEMPDSENKPVKNTFSSIWIIDNQSVMVPFKGTLEFDIQHRFGLVYNGYEDFWGLYAPSNIRLGLAYVPINNLMVGFGLTKKNLTWDINAKYAILKQMISGGSPVSLSYFVNAAIDSRDKNAFTNADELVFSDRLSYFHQLLLARKISDKLSVQIAGSLSHFNTIYPAPGLEDGSVQQLDNDHFALAISAKYMVTNTMNILVNYDHPLTTRPSIDPEFPDSKDPKPNFSFGVEFNTSAHQFQIFLGNYNSIIPQTNNTYNTNWGFGNKSFSLWDPEWLIGFNITRLWSY
ncbi:MAG: DUF5777 family beta-barrel protein [Saprospiraceae bacterium]